MTTKLKIKMGHMEFDYEGDVPFGMNEVKELFGYLETLRTVAPNTPVENMPATGQENSEGSSPSAELQDLAPNTVAARLSVKSGGDLAIAAAASLQLCRGQDSFVRKELLTTMQSATNYYKSGMSGNLSSILKGLISGGRINSLSNDRMSLSASEQTALKAKVAQ